MGLWGFLTRMVLVVNQLQQLIWALPTAACQPDAEKGGHAGIEEGAVEFYLAGVHTCQTMAAPIDIFAADLQIDIRKFLKQSEDLNVRDIDPIKLPVFFYMVKKLPETIFQFPGVAVGTVILPQGDGKVR